MAGELIEVATAGATIWLVADRPDALPDYLVHGLRLTATTASGAAASVELRFMDELTLPVELGHV